MPNIQQGVNQLLGLSAAAATAYGHYTPQGQAKFMDTQASRLEKLGHKYDSQEHIDKAQDLRDKAFETHPTKQRWESASGNVEAEKQLAAEKKQQQEYRNLYGQQRGIAKGQEKLINNENVKLFQSSLIDPKTNEKLIAEAGVLQKGGIKQ